MCEDVELAENPISDADIHAFALSLPSTYMTEQWMGSHVYKIGDRDTYKMFAILNPGKRQLTVKTPNRDMADMLINAGVAKRHTHMPRGSWVMLLLETLERDDVQERITSSHRLVVKAMTGPTRKKFGLD